MASHKVQNNNTYTMLVPQCMYILRYDSLLQLLLWPEVAGVTTLLLTTVVCTRMQPSIASAAKEEAKNLIKAHQLKF